MRIAHLLPILLIGSLCSAQTIAAPLTGADFHSRVIALYSFEPHELKLPEMTEKSGQMDKFWSEVKADPAKMLPLLRNELEEPAQPSFFYYDGSQLLLSLSRERSDKVLASHSIPKVNFKDVDQTDYVRTVQRLASAGIDTREAAFRVLEDPAFTAIIPQHALTLGQNFSLMYMLFPMDETIFEPSLEKRLEQESDPEAQKTLLLALWYAAMPAAETAISRFAGTAGKPEQAREYAKQLLKQKIPSLTGLGFSSEQALREDRRKVMQRPISDEALMEFDHLTAKLRAKL